MPPVISAPSSEVDNEATAELPVLDVAAYEATLDGSEEVAHTDTWVLPSTTFTPVAHGPEATTEMPALRPDAVPTLTKSVPAYDLDHSGTHEMPPLPESVARRAKAQSASKRSAAKQAATKTAASKAVVENPALSSGPIVVPPSPPLIEELRGALANAERRIEELQEHARIADAERSVAITRANAESAQLREQLGAQIETLTNAQERLGAQVKDQSELVGAYEARGDRIAALEKELAAQAGLLQQAQAQLNARDQRAETLDCDVMNLRATVARRNAQILMLEADMAARQQRETALTARLAEALAAVNPDVPGLHAEIASHAEKLRALKADCAQLRTLVQEKDSDLQVAEESIRQLEADLRNKTAKLEEASVTVEEWRAVIAESQRSILQRDGRIQQLDARVQQLEADVQQQRFSNTLDTSAQTGEEVLLEGPARVLIRTDGNTDFVHVLGRRTRIGRGSDNELVLDTKHVSRYHAVLLAGPVSTSIEDLNSTNGVFVNGKRITRQALKDGDRVTVGKTQFRYNVRD